MSDPFGQEASETTIRDAALMEAARRQAEEFLREQTLTLPPRDGARAGQGSGRGAMPPADSFPGYELVREVGGGGQGTVYEAVQQSTKKRVAIKVMREGPFASPGEKARFDREVHILAQLKHPNIVGILHSGSAAGVFYYVMDYISGYPLDRYVLRARGSTSRKVEVENVLKLFSKICAAVNAAHLRGVTHRDLKPGNIIVGSDGEPYILDFGLAKLAVPDPDAPIRTETGLFLGSLPWASPEQARGRPHEIDLRTDVYSLGVILYQMLTDRFPYEVIGNMRDVLNRIVEQEPARPSTARRRINNEVETIILKCLAKQRERRYQSAGELGRDLQRYLAREPIEAKRDSLWYVVRKLCFRNAMTAATVGLLIAILLGCGVVSGYYYLVSREAVAEREEKANLALEQARQLSSLATRTFPEMERRMRLGWFLAEWYDGRVDRARAIQETFRTNTPEYEAAAFLLDDSYAFERLLGEMPDDLRALAFFVSGERHRKAGRVNDAIVAFKHALSDSNDWIKEAAEARLTQLIQSDTVEQTSESEP